MKNNDTLLKRAQNISEIAHKGQVDKAGKPYIKHCEYVSEHANTYEGKIVGYLHDIMEDTDFPPEVLLEVFGDDIFEILKILTHEKYIPYKEYIKGVMTNPIAVEVKMADLSHNMDMSRLKNPTERDYKRLKKYKAAYDMLNEFCKYK